jgi:hypothetical protein
MGGRVSRFQVSSEGGHVVTSKANFWIALAPYFFRFTALSRSLFMACSSFFVNVQPCGRLLYAVIGATWHSISRSPAG